jgi:hypothetical protein
MSDPVQRRDNAFLLAAVALPVVVVGLFVIASAIPRWRVPPPAFDLLIQADGPYQPKAAPIVVNFSVREGRVLAEVTPTPPQTSSQLPALYLFDHATATVREVTVHLPARLDQGEESRMVPVEALAERRVLEGPHAPDGYMFEIRSRGGSGLVGEIFGMGRYDNGAAIVNRGRVITIPIPPPYRYSVRPVGWLAPGDAR